MAIGAGVILGLGGLLRLLGEEDCLDVGEDTSLGNGDTSKQLVQLLIIPDGELEVAGDNSGLLVVSCSVASQFKDLSCKVFHDSSQVDWGTSSNTLSIVALAEESVDTANWELESCPAGPGLCLALRFSSFATSRHVDRSIAQRGTDSHRRRPVLVSPFSSRPVPVPTTNSGSPRSASSMPCWNTMEVGHDNGCPLAGIQTHIEAQKSN